MYIYIYIHKYQNVGKACIAAGVERLILVSSLGMYMHIFICIYMYTCIYIYIYIYIHMNTYTHTYIYTHIYVCIIFTCARSSSRRRSVSEYSISSVAHIYIYCTPTHV